MRLRSIQPSSAGTWRTWRCLPVGDVRWAIWDIGDDQTIFGSVCADELSELGKSQGRQHRLVAYVEVNLLLMVQGLSRVADGETDVPGVSER
ncbi:hypothetical protein [Actinoplanes sp. URMC 104]|uniref:hypothetical protein n=1 Tax=Actinoplanes sp. URMC 104 TaxID=3423409 RepID=UPI003F1AADB4